ncbi:DUF4148 domain-containing protein [Achromobacter mucicolens]|uniref:DUF4148 domain-containing protein n=1 Tax=Achromobacter mucicolens TaxID=1389922 RepID=A0ABD4YZD7_9BURK|nr:DUF4148 domain-containing protein [Achromobacter mucicolens]MDH1180867.1 DUF4148 domain-containing protein [Achromobacter mucicolens]
MKASLNILCVVMAFAFGPQAVAQATATSAPQQPAQVSTERGYSDRGLTRAEVRADLAVWKRAGMDKFWNKSQTPDIYSREYRMAHAEYIRMRNGPEYKEALRRLQ